MNEGNELADVKANFGLVLFGFISDLQRLKKFIETQTDLKIRYQRVSLGKLFIELEGDNGNHPVKGRRRRQPFEEGSLDK